MRWNEGEVAGVDRGRQKRSRPERVSIDVGLALRVEEHVGGRGLSGFVARAVAHELERDTLRAYLDELDDQLGPVPAQLIESYDALWP
ncbi:MAG: hypothetical protein M3083_03550 [Actinomycetota bacterium]|nr:hypothetical protein [Actinomycetota bacterium]